MPKKFVNEQYILRQQIKDCNLIVMAGFSDMVP
jgi:hypothetical protein